MMTEESRKLDRAARAREIAPKLRQAVQRGDLVAIDNLLCQIDLKQARPDADLVECASSQ